MRNQHNDNKNFRNESECVLLVVDKKIIFENIDGLQILSQVLLLKGAWLNYDKKFIDCLIP